MRQDELHLEPGAHAGMRSQGRDAMATGKTGELLRGCFEETRPCIAGRVETESGSSMESQPTAVAFVIPGEVVGKGRPRFAKRGNFVQAYTPERTASYENLVKLHSGIAMNGRQPISLAVSCTISIDVMPPASWSQKKRAAALSGVLFPTSKPDLDNCAKGIFDAMNGIVWLDDKQVVDMRVVKRYSQVARAAVEVRPL